MPAKKKGKKGKKGKKKGGAVKPPSLSDHVPLVLDMDDELWVTLELKLVNWQFMDFELRLRTTTPLFSIKKQLKERHGRTDDLRLYKDSPTSDCELTNDLLTLEEVGVEGRTKTEIPVKKVTLFYDFKPYLHDDPLLLVARTRDE